MSVSVDGARLTFRLGWEGVRGEHHEQRERVALIDIELDEPLAFEGWMKDWVQPLVDFVALATREPSRIEAFTAIITRDAPALWWKRGGSAVTEEHREAFRGQRMSL